MNIVNEINKRNEKLYNGKCKDGCGNYNDYCECLDWETEQIPSLETLVKVKFTDGTRGILKLVDVEEFGITFTDGDLYYNLNTVTSWKYLK